MIPFLDVGLTYLTLRPQIDDAIDRVLTGGNYISGEEVEHFEEEWANYCGANFAVGVSNGLDAIFLSLIAIGVGDGDEVIVPANTYIGTWLAISRTDAQIIPVEPVKDYNIDPNRILQAIQKKLKRYSLYIYGQAADMVNPRNR